MDYCLLDEDCHISMFDTTTTQQFEFYTKIYTASQNANILFIGRNAMFWLCMAGMVCLPIRADLCFIWQGKDPARPHLHTYFL
ncbi:hypothetical protein BME53_09025 [Klebsiella quasipneumoniae subsp. similipneumoniae]|jgi:hypothetical protein|nr:hypothetical protein BME61_16630 [Klebsiella quasipneumoniae subsp. similipneumoniae]OVW12743.1 hypothetical protein BME58_23720 [Klebsiella quasipneumoniae subsp. similipneumoniae]OVW21295.1 hypothetical protein BME56_21860 [Klebsiella quasipneumoniae subsp. similipneumoniae]OVW31399.1 hypothetical protein BME53_09025 [Klebsiella quasipneumoniae subsp. similipneumoniae]